VAQLDAQPVLDLGDVICVQGGQLRAAEGAGEPDQQQGPVPVVY
jgi:hypothetical protein